MAHIDCVSISSLFKYLLSFQVMAWRRETVFYIGKSPWVHHDYAFLSFVCLILADTNESLFSMIVAFKKSNVFTSEL